MKPIKSIAELEALNLVKLYKNCREISKDSLFSNLLVTGMEHLLIYSKGKNLREFFFNVLKNLCQNSIEYLEQVFKDSFDALKLLFDNKQLKFLNSLVYSSSFNRLVTYLEEKLEFPNIKNNESQVISQIAYYSEKMKISVAIYSYDREKLNFSQVDCFITIVIYNNPNKIFVLYPYEYKEIFHIYDDSYSESEDMRKNNSLDASDSEEYATKKFKYFSQKFRPKDLAKKSFILENNKITKFKQISAIRELEIGKRIIQKSNKSVGERSSTQKKNAETQKDKNESNFKIENLLSYNITSPPKTRLKKIKNINDFSLLSDTQKITEDGNIIMNCESKDTELDQSIDVSDNQGNANKNEIIMIEVVYKLFDDKITENPTEPKELDLIKNQEKLMIANDNEIELKLAEAKLMQEKIIEDEKRIALERKAIEDKIQSEEIRLSLERKINEEKRIFDLIKLDEERKAYEEAMLIEKNIISLERKAHEDQISAEKTRIQMERKQDEERIANEFKKLAEEKKLIEKMRISEEIKIAQEKKRLEDKKLKIDKKINEKKKLAEEIRINLEKKIAEEKRIAEERQIVDEKQKEYEFKLVEQKQIADEKQKEYEFKIANDKDRKIAEENKIAEEFKKFKRMKKIEEKKMLEEILKSKKKELLDLKLKTEEMLLLEKKRLLEQEISLSENKLTEKKVENLRKSFKEIRLREQAIPKDEYAYDPGRRSADKRILRNNKYLKDMSAEKVRRSSDNRRIPYKNLIEEKQEKDSLKKLVELRVRQDLRFLMNDRSFSNTAKTLFEKNPDREAKLFEDQEIIEKKKLEEQKTLNEIIRIESELNLEKEIKPSVEMIYKKDIEIQKNNTPEQKKVIEGDKMIKKIFFGQEKSKDYEIISTEKPESIEKIKGTNDKKSYCGGFYCDKCFKYLKRSNYFLKCTVCCDNYLKKSQILVSKPLKKYEFKECMECGIKIARGEEVNCMCCFLQKIILNESPYHCNGCLKKDKNYWIDISQGKEADMSFCGFCDEKKHKLALINICRSCNDQVCLACLRKNSYISQSICSNCHSRRNIYIN